MFQGTACLDEQAAIIELSANDIDKTVSQLQTEGLRRCPLDAHIVLDPCETADLSPSMLLRAGTAETKTLVKCISRDPQKPDFSEAEAFSIRLLGVSDLLNIESHPHWDASKFNKDVPLNKVYCNPLSLFLKSNPGPCAICSFG